MTYQKDFEALLDLLIVLIEANSNRPIGNDEHLAHAHFLTIKMFRHLVSMANVASGVHVEQQEVVFAHYYDFSSVDVLLRAAIETHLAFNFIYSPNDEDIIRFRHLAWRYGGLKQRLKLIPTIDEAKEKHRLTQLEHDALWVELESSPYFQALGKYGKNKIADGCWDVGLGWVRLATDAGFHSDYFHNVYSYCCSHAHSDFVSAMQIACAQKLQEQQDLSFAGFGTACMVLAHHARLFLKVFPNTMPAYLSNEAAIAIADKWYIRAEDLGDIYPPDESDPK